MTEKTKYFLAIKEKSSFSIEKAHYLLTFLLPKQFKAELEGVAEAKMEIAAIKATALLAIKRSIAQGSIHMHWDHLGGVYNYHKKDIDSLVVVKGTFILV